MRKTLRAVGMLSVVLAMVLGMAYAGVVLADEPQVIDVAIRIAPGTLALDSEGEWVTVHANIAYGAVATSSLSLSGIPVRWTKADSRGNLVAKFALADVKAIVAPPTATLVLEGMTKDGVAFAGSATVAVKATGP